MTFKRDSPDGECCSLCKAFKFHDIEGARCRDCPI